MWCLLFVFFLGSFVLSEAKLPLPPYIQACHKDDPNIDACALKNGKLAIQGLLKGDKKYGFPAFNPLELEKIEVETQGNLSISFSKVKISGLDSLDIKQVRIDLPGKNLFFDLKIETLNILGQYQMDGKILVIPLQGNGDCNLTATNVDAKLTMKYDLIEKDGDTYIQLRDNNLDIDLDKLQFQFDRLFNGNEELGRTTNQLLNEEWRSVYTELKPAISNTIITIAVTLINRLTEKVPYNVIFP